MDRVAHHCAVVVSEVPRGWKRRRNAVEQARGASGGTCFEASLL